MPGQIRLLIDDIVAKRSKGNWTVASTTRTKLILKGIVPERFTAASADDEAILAKLRAIAVEWGLQP